MSQRLIILGTGCLLLMGLVLLRARPSSVTEGTPMPAPAVAAPAEARTTPTQPGPGFIGIIVAGGSVEVSAKFDGRLEQVMARVGDRVHKGEVLARLDTQPLQHELAIATADVQAARAEEEVARLALVAAQEALKRGGDTRLVSLGAMSEEEQARLRFAEKTASAKLAAAQAQVQSREAQAEQLRLRLSEASVRAPFDAQVSMRYLDPGALVTPGLAIVHLLADGAQQVRFAIPEALAPGVEAGARVRLEVTGQPTHLEGVVERVSPEVDTASRMVLAIASVPARPGPRLPLGTVVRVWVTSGDAVGSLAGP